MRTLESHICGRWHSPPGEGFATHHAVTGLPVAGVSSDGIDFSAVVGHARHVGGPALRALTFHERAALLKALGQYLLTEKDHLYDCLLYTSDAADE